MNNNIKNSITTFYIELTNICNFNCAYCPIHKMKREKGLMPITTVKRIIDEVYEKQISSWICLHLMGEPTLHPNFFEIIDYLNKRNLDVSLITNGSFPAVKLATGLKDVKLASLQISINTFGENKYNLKRSKEIDYGKYIENIKDFIRIYYCFNDSTPILLSYLLTENRYTQDNIRLVNNKQEAISILKYWKLFSMGLNPNSQNKDFPRKLLLFASKASYLTSLRILGSTNFEKHLRLSDPEPIYRISPTIFIYFKGGGNWHNTLIDDSIVVKKSSKGTCKIIDNEFAVLWNGNCTFCCGDFDGKIELGNIYQSSIEEILLGEIVKQVRQDNRNLILSQEICQTCKGRLYDKKRNTKVALNRPDFVKEIKQYYLRYGFKELVKKIISKLK